VSRAVAIGFPSSDNGNDAGFFIAAIFSYRFHPGCQRWLRPIRTIPALLLPSALCPK